MTSTSNGPSTNSDAALLELLAPDGYYQYLGVSKPAVAVAASTAPPSSHSKDDPGATGTSASGSSIDEDLVKKNYRKLSLKHHPDKGGNADTFRLLNRAQRVLLDPKLRKQYDIVGIDLDDDDLHQGDNTDNDSDDPNKDASQSSSQGIVQEIASNVLAGVLQLGVRTRTYHSFSLQGLCSKFCSVDELTSYVSISNVSFLLHIEIGWYL
jgi:DnaJ domain